MKCTEHSAVGLQEERSHEGKAAQWSPRRLQNPRNRGAAERLRGTLEVLGEMAKKENSRENQKTTLALPKGMVWKTETDL